MSKENKLDLPDDPEPDSFGKAFDIEPPEDTLPAETEVPEQARDGFIGHWDPIPRLKVLKELVEDLLLDCKTKLFPPRRGGLS
jgi:hypothetical protein